MAGQSDRLFLEDTSESLEKRLLTKLVKGKDFQECDIHDFEVRYRVSGAEDGLHMDVSYPWLSGVLQHGSQSLLERVWDGLPLQLGVATDSLKVTVQADQLGDDVALRERCVQQLLYMRVWLLIGPLVEKLTWLRDNTATGGNRNTTVSNTAAPPPLVACQLRPHESCWIITKPDRVVVIFSVQLDDEGDIALGKNFCQEFAETNRKPSDSTLPCTFTEPKEPPPDLRGLNVGAPPNVGYISLTVSDQQVRGLSDDRLQQLATPVMTFRNFFNFHLKNAKSYLHSRLRKRMEGWQQTMKQAKRAPRKGQEQKRRTIGGKEFVAKPAAGGYTS